MSTPEQEHDGDPQSVKANKTKKDSPSISNSNEAQNKAEKKRTKSLEAFIPPDQLATLAKNSSTKPAKTAREKSPSSTPEEKRAKSDKNESEPGKIKKASSKKANNKKKSLRDLKKDVVESNKEAHEQKQQDNSVKFATEKVDEDSSSAPSSTPSSAPSSTTGTPSQSAKRSKSKKEHKTPSPDKHTDDHTHHDKKLKKSNTPNHEDNHATPLSAQTDLQNLSSRTLSTISYESLLSNMSINLSNKKYRKQFIGANGTKLISEKAVATIHITSLLKKFINIFNDLSLVYKDTSRILFGTPHFLTSLFLLLQKLHSLRASGDGIPVDEMDYCTKEIYNLLSDILAYNVKFHVEEEEGTHTDKDNQNSKRRYEVLSNVLQIFDVISYKNGDLRKFSTLMQHLTMSSRIVQISILKFIVNGLLSPIVPNKNGITKEQHPQQVDEHDILHLNHRVHLRLELAAAGLDSILGGLSNNKVTEIDDLVKEYYEKAESDFNRYKSISSQNNNDSALLTKLCDEVKASCAPSVYKLFQAVLIDLFALERDQLQGIPKWLMVSQVLSHIRHVNPLTVKQQVLPTSQTSNAGVQSLSHVHWVTQVYTVFDKVQNLTQDIVAQIVNPDRNSDNDVKQNQKEEVDILQQQIQTHKENAKHTEASLTKIQQEFQALQQTQRNLESQIEEKVEHQKEQQILETSLRNKLDALEQEKTELGVTLQDKHQKITNLEQQIDSLTELRAGHDSTILQLQSQLQQLQKEIDIEKAQKKELPEPHAADLSQLSELQTLRTENEALNIKIKSLQEIEKQHAEQLQQLDEQQKLLKQLQEETQRQQQQIKHQEEHLKQQEEQKLQRQIQEEEKQKQEEAEKEKHLQQQKKQQEEQLKQQEEQKLQRQKQEDEEKQKQLQQKKQQEEQLKQQEEQKQRQEEKERLQRQQQEGEKQTDQHQIKNISSPQEQPKGRNVPHNELPEEDKEALRLFKSFGKYGVKLTMQLSTPSINSSGSTTITGTATSASAASVSSSSFSVSPASPPVSESPRTSPIKAKQQPVQQPQSQPLSQQSQQQQSQQSQSQQPQSQQPQSQQSQQITTKQSSTEETENGEDAETKEEARLLRIVNSRLAGRATSQATLKNT